jgi:biotin carboxyl carrier protein
VKESDLVLTLEAMKMYTPINAVAAGTITAIHVKVGDAVEEGQALYTIG